MILGIKLNNLVENFLNINLLIEDLEYPANSNQVVIVILEEKVVVGLFVDSDFQNVLHIVELFVVLEDFHCEPGHNLLDKSPKFLGSLPKVVEFVIGIRCINLSRQF